MLIVRADLKKDEITLASVGIVDRVGNCIYERFLAPPSDRRIDRRFCHVTDTQFLYANRDEDAQFPVVRAEVLDILCR